MYATYFPVKPMQDATGGVVSIQCCIIFNNSSSSPADIM